MPCALADAAFLSSLNCTAAGFVSLERCEQSRLHRVWLASFPGSGNTWTRLMLELATGLRTGSTDVDGAFLRLGLAGEGKTDAAETLVIKNHYPQQFPWDLIDTNPIDFAPAIVLIRHPLSAALSHTHNQHAGHSMELSEAKLRQFFERDRDEHLAGWRRHTEFWQSYGGQTLVVRYEDVVRAPIAVYQRRLLPFLGVHAAVDRLRCAVDGASLPQTRRHHSYNFSWSEADTAATRRVVGEKLMAEFEYLSQPPA